ncbi:unnamed protein product [Diplocarpon coronariae]|uniref:Uncharacterized protein n=1 Tax=Diplocarpon coronariae TaxID=2795749 RepID=A0A218Z0P6_9HELO|nr:hypothetical protein B2J93_7030 [Marssonina coronariae]
MPTQIPATTTAPNPACANRLEVGFDIEFAAALLVAPDTALETLDAAESAAEGLWTTDETTPAPMPVYVAAKEEARSLALDSTTLASDEQTASHGDPLQAQPQCNQVSRCKAGWLPARAFGAQLFGRQTRGHRRAPLSPTLLSTPGEYACPHLPMRVAVCCVDFKTGSRGAVMNPCRLAGIVDCLDGKSG